MNVHYGTRGHPAGGSRGQVTGAGRSHIRCAVHTVVSPAFKRVDPFPTTAGSSSAAPGRAPDETRYAAAAPAGCPGHGLPRAADRRLVRPQGARVLPLDRDARRAVGERGTTTAGYRSRVRAAYGDKLPGSGYAHSGRAGGCAEVCGPAVGSAAAPAPGPVVPAGAATLRAPHPRPPWTAPPRSRLPELCSPWPSAASPRSAAAGTGRRPQPAPERRPDPALPGVFPTRTPERGSVR
ncbi:hypothetical protein NKH18_10865 [Streptomyces sp. M10(2022)]